MVFSKLILGILSPVLIGLLTMTTGCASLRAKPGDTVTVQEIIRMSQAGVPAQRIIEKMEDSDSVYRLKASQLAELRQEGVPDAVIDHMQRTHLESVRQEQARFAWRYRTMGPNGYLFYPPW